jgi:hypothetical protein
MNRLFFESELRRLPLFELVMATSGSTLCFSARAGRHTIKGFTAFIANRAFKYATSGPNAE